MNKLLPYFDEQKVQTWLEDSSHQEIRRIKQKILDNITYIDEKTFDKAIKSTTKKFIKEIKNEEYIVLFDDRAYSSKRWVFLKIKHLLNKELLSFKSYFSKKTNLKFTTYSSMPNLTEKIVSENIKHIVIFDDAMYSGNQNNNILHTIKILSKKYEEFRLNVQKWRLSANIF